MSQHGYTIKNPLDILTKEQVKSIHRGALDVLENTGVVFHHEKALNILHDAGCKVDKEKERVRFPGYLVEECLSKCPSSFTVKARNPKYNLRLGDPIVYFSVYPAQDRFDLDTLEKRPPTLDEYIKDLKVQNYLDQVHWAGYFSGVPRAEDALFTVNLVLGNARNAEKAGYLGANPDYVRLLIAINTILGSTGLTSVAASPPLTWYGPQIDILLTAAEAGFPLKPVSGLTAGANAPATLAGALVQSLAEVMSAIVLGQVFKPGIPVIAQDYSQPLDMRTGAVIQGGIERGLLGVAWCQIWRSYGIPRMTMISSDSKVPDYQCAMEKVMSVTVHALAGSNIITFMGGIYDELTGSPLVTIIDNDVGRMVGRLLRGIDVNDNTLAVDLIQNVGPIPGHFLNKRHTKETWQAEQLIPDLADRTTFPEWLKQGKRDIISRAREKYQEILATYEPMPLTEEQEKELEKIIQGLR